MRKVVVIGVGGTGTRVILRVRELFEWRHNVEMSQVPFVEYLGMDSAEENRPELGPDFVYMDIGEKDLGDVLSAKQENRYNWLDESIAAKVQDGTGAVRMLGKLTFLNPPNYLDFERKLSLKLRRIDGVAATELGEDLGLGHVEFDGVQKVYVVANLVSGTGSGAFIDIGYSVRKVIRDLQTDGRIGGNFEITGLFTLPDDIAADRLHAANAYQALEELNYYCSDDVAYHIDSPTDPGHLLRFEQMVRPYDFTYLLSVQRAGAEENQVTSHQQLESLLADFIYSDILLPLAVMRDGRRADIRNQFFDNDNLECPRKFMTFGMSTIEYPIAQVARGCTYRFLVESINQWFNMGGRDDTNGRAPWASRTYTAEDPHADPVPYHLLLHGLHLGEGGFRDEGTPANALIRPVTVEGQDVAIVDRYEQLIDGAARNYTGDPGQLHRVESAIEHGFIAQYTGVATGTLFPPGIVDAVIRQNANQFIEEFPSMLQEMVANLVFGTRDRAEYGPHYARQFLERVESRLKNIGDQGDSDAGTGTLAKVSGQACRELELIRDDFLLASPFGMMRGMANSWALRQYRQAALDYFDAKLLAAIQSCYADVVQALYRHVSRLMKRLENFEDYMVNGIRLQFIEQYKKQTESIVVNGVDPLHDDVAEEITDQHDRIQPAVDRKAAHRQFVAGLKAPELSSLALELAPQDPKQPTRMDGDMGELRPAQTEEGRPQYRIAFDHEQDLVTTVRGRFVTQLRGINVIGRFRGKGGVPSEVAFANAQAQPFILLRAPDPYIHENLQIMAKAWYAYPGGGAIDQTPDRRRIPPTETTRWFAAQIAEGLGGIDWPEESVDSHSDQSIIFWKERGAFPLRQLVLVEAMRDQRQKWLTPSDDSERQKRGHNYLLSRMDVCFEPLSEEGRQELMQAEITFFIAVAAGIAKHDSSADVFKVRANWLLGGMAVLPSDHRLAKFELYRNAQTLRRIRDQLYKWREEGPGDPNAKVVQAIHAMLVNPPQLGLQLPKDNLTNPTDQEYERIAHIVLAGYVAPDPELRRAWEQTGFQPSQLTDHTPVEVHGPNEDSVSYPVESFYCKKCGMNRGMPRKLNGEPDESQLQPICPRCARGQH